MPNFPWRPHQEEAGIPDATLASLVAGSAAAGVAAGLQPLAEFLAALTASASGDELAGEGAALATFRELGPGAEPHARPGPAIARPRGNRFAAAGRPPLARAATVAVVAALGLGGAVAAAFAGALPAPIQQLAHVLMDAPAAPAPRGGPPSRGHPGSGPPPTATGSTSRTGSPAATARPFPDAPSRSGQPTPSHHSPHPTPSHPTPPHPSPHPTPPHPTPYYPTPSHPSPHPTPPHASPHATPPHSAAVGAAGPTALPRAAPASAQ